MGYRKTASKYSAAQSSEIRFQIMDALQNLATFNGIDIATMQSTAPYSFKLNGVTSQKIMVELKKLIDSGMVVKGAARGDNEVYDEVNLRRTSKSWKGDFKNGIRRLSRFESRIRRNKRRGKSDKRSN